MNSSMMMNFMLSDDGRTLLAVQQGKDGNLELLSVPVAVLPCENGISLPQALKLSNGDTTLNELKLHDVSISIQQPLSPTQVIKLTPSDDCTVSEKRCQSETNSFPLNQSQQFNSENLQSRAEPISERQKTELESNLVPNEVPINLHKKSSKKHRRKSGRPKKNIKNEEEEEEEPACFKCDICGQEFKKQYLMQKHMHDHAQEKPHHCPKCPASFNVPTNFTLHMATHCLSDPKCPECGKKFARIASLKSHMQVHGVDENLYCTECEDTFETKAQLEAHLKLHNEKWTADDYRRCKLCRKQFTQPVLYRQHLRDHYRMQMKCARQTKRGIRHRTVYKCRICLKVFEKPSQLARHIRVHTGEKPYKCNLCFRSFSQKGSVRIHMWQHNGIRPYSCSFCHAQFSQKGNLNSHVLRVHSVQKGGTVYRCTQCPCVFKKLGSLNGHMRRAHEGKPCNDEPPDKDEEEEEEQEEEEQQPIEQDEIENTSPEACAKGKEAEMDFEDGFVVTDEGQKTAMVTLLDKDSKGKYVKIKQRFVNNSRQYECSHCDKVFKKPSDLMRHLRIHTREKPFKCKICDRSFTLKSTLQSHEKTHRAENKFPCDECSMVLCSEEAYDAHKAGHKDGYECRICDKRFPTFDELRSHTAVHSTKRKDRKKAQPAPEVQNLLPKVVLKEPLVLTETSNGLLHAQPKYRNELAHGKGRPHKCPACSAGFMKFSHLKQHYRKHTGERPFTCNFCDKGFATQSALKAHHRTHDLLRPYQCSICHSNFTTLSSMKRHQVTHSNKRPFMCPYCNKTFKTTVNCRKHIRLHKQEIAQQQLEQEKSPQKESPTSDNFDNSVMSSNVKVTMTEPTFINNPEVTFQHVSSNLVQNLNGQIQSTVTQDSFPTVPLTSQNIHITTQNIPIVNSNIGTTQTLHADENGTVTLANYTGDQMLTSENIREIEETLNQQLYSIGMNLALNNSTKMNEESNNTTLESQNHPILSIVYDNGKTMESPISTSINANVFASQFDNFDINQLTLQSDNEMGIGISQISPANIASFLANSVQENPQFTLPLVSTDSEMDTILKQSLGKSEDRSMNVADKNNKSLFEESNLQCHMCNIQGLTADDLKEHLKTHQGKREFECTHCILKFCTSGGLSRHMKIHEVPEKHKCYECNQEFPTTLKLRQHIKEHVKRELALRTGTEAIIDDIELKSEEGSSKRNNKCAYCTKTFRKPSDLTRHVRTHTGERPYQCQFCEKSFAVKCTLDSHLKIHGGKKSFHCHVCNSTFTTKGSLKVHMRLHTGSKPFECDMCGMKFRTSGHRKVHMVSHTRETNSAASKSKQKIDVTAETEKDETADNERIVRIVHTTTEPHQIMTQPTDGQNMNTITLNSDNDQITLNAHNADGAGLLALDENNQLVSNLQYLLENGLVTIQMEDVPESSTDVVQNGFVTAHVDQNQMTEQLNAYASEMGNVITETMDENDAQLNNCVVLRQAKSPSGAAKRECDICGKAFAKPCQLERHLRIHTGERPFKCDLCEKSFAQKSTLHLHQKHHTGDRPHPCPHCERSFIQNGNLLTHLKRVHKVDPVETKRRTKGQQQFVVYSPKPPTPLQQSGDVLGFDDISFGELLK